MGRPACRRAPPRYGATVWRSDGLDRQPGRAPPSAAPAREGRVPPDDETGQLSPDLEELGQLLIECPDEDEAMLLGELDGYLAGILVSPHGIAQAELLPGIWGGAPAAFTDDPVL